MGGSASAAWWMTCTKARPPRPVAGRRVAFVGPLVLERGVRPRENPRRRRSHRRRRARSLPFEGLRLRMLDTHAVVRSLTDAEIHAGPGGRHHERGPSGRRAPRRRPARSVHGQPRRGEGRIAAVRNGDRRGAEAPVPVPVNRHPARSTLSTAFGSWISRTGKPGGGWTHGLPPVGNGDRRVRVRSLRTAQPQATLENGVHRGDGSVRRADPRGSRAEPRQRRHAPGKDRAPAVELVAGPPEVNGRPGQGDPVDRPSSLTASTCGAVHHTAAASLIHRPWSGIAVAAG